MNLLGFCGGADCIDRTFQHFNQLHGSYVETQPSVNDASYIKQIADDLVLRLRASQNRVDCARDRLLIQLARTQQPCLPTIEFKGLRSSWDTVARKSSF